MTTPRIDTQRRHARTGAIRIGNRVPTGGVDHRGQPRMRPNKLDRFRVTTPHLRVAEAVAELFGGAVARWASQTGPEFEVITTVRELPVLVPPQSIDPNYELWGNKIRERFCDGATERLRGTSCLCRRFDNHEHRWRSGKNTPEACQICGLLRSWRGPEHEHQYDTGECVICGCRRPCKPTTRLNVMLRGVPSIGVFKLESHGFTAAAELPGFADMISQAPMPLPARLTMRYVDSMRLVVRGSGEGAEARQYWVPELTFDWLTPDMAYAGASQLETAARAQISAGSDRLAIGAAPAAESDAEPETDEERLTEDAVIKLATKAINVPQVKQLWRDASRDKVLTDRVSRHLTARAEVLRKEEDAKKNATEPEPEPEGEIYDAEVIDDWPTTAQPPA